MIDPKRLQKVTQANCLPLHQESKRQLQKAGQKPDPDTSYLFQLLLWGLQQKISVLKSRNDLEDLADRLAYQTRPKRRPESPPEAAGGGIPVPGGGRAGEPGIPGERGGAGGEYTTHSGSFGPGLASGPLLVEEAASEKETAP